MGSPKTPEEPLAYHEDKLDWERMSYCVTQELREPTDSPHVRAASMYVPHLEDVPSVSVRIISDPGSTPLMVSSLKINKDVAGYTQITVAAQTRPPAGGPVKGAHYCNIIAIGKTTSSQVEAPA
jgi:hypothetical protein